MAALDPDRVERSWARLLDELPDLCAVLDGYAVVRHVSSSATRLLGVSPARLIGRCACDLMDPLDGRNASAWFSTVVRGAAVPEYVHRLRRADGSYGWFETRVRAVRSPAGDPLALTVSRDVSTRTELDHQLLTASRMWSDVCDVLRQGVLVFDSTGTILASNATASVMLGTDRADLTGSPLASHLHPQPDEGPHSRLDVDDLRHRRGATRMRVLRPDGIELKVIARTAGLRGSSGTSAASLSVLLLDGLDSGDATGAASAQSARAQVSTGLLDLPATLSRRELEVLTLLIDGLDVKAISIHLDISVHTTRSYVKSVLRKLDVRTQLQAVVTALRAGLIDLS